MSAAKALVARATLSGHVVTVAESCTGGMVAAAITDVPGSSAMFGHGFITYSNDAKKAMLGVRAATLAAHGAVSEEVAREMALGALSQAGADLALAITGIAGPGGSEHKPEGRVCFGLATHAGVTMDTVEFGALGRAEVRRAARDHGLHILLGALPDPHSAH